MGGWAQCETLVGRTVDELGGLDVLVNKAGIAPVPPSPTPHTVVHAAAKAGLNAATLAAAQELGPEEVAFMILALTDPAASLVNDAVVTVGGGMTTQGR